MRILLALILAAFSCGVYSKPPSEIIVERVLDCHIESVPYKQKGLSLYVYADGRKWGGGAWDGSYPIYATSEADARLTIMSYGRRPITNNTASALFDSYAVLQSDRSGNQPPWICRIITDNDTPPPPPVSCTLKGSLSLSHGTLEPAAINGHTQRTSFGVDCTGAASYRLKFQGGSSADPDLGNGVSSRFHINGVYTPVGVDIPRKASEAGVILLDWRSTLSAATKNIPPGDLQWSGVLQLTMD